MNAGTLATVFQWTAIVLTFAAVLAQAGAAYYRNVASAQSAAEIATLKGRSLSEQQKAILHRELSKASGPVGFNYRLMDGEGHDFANQLAEVFRLAGWDVRHIAGNSLNDFQGYFVVATADPSLKDVAKVACDALNAAGIKCHDDEEIRQGTLGGPLEQGNIYIVIGRKL